MVDWGKSWLIVRLSELAYSAGHGHGVGVSVGVSVGTGCGEGVAAAAGTAAAAAVAAKVVGGTAGAAVSMKLLQGCPLPARVSTARVSTALHQSSPQSWVCLCQTRSRQRGAQKCAVLQCGHAYAVASPQPPQMPGRTTRTGAAALRGRLRAMVRAHELDGLPTQRKENPRYRWGFKSGEG